VGSPNTRNGISFPQMISLQSTILTPLVQRRVNKYPRIVHSSRPSNGHLSESTNVVHHSLHDDRVPTFSVVVIGRTLSWRYNWNVFHRPPVNIVESPVHPEIPQQPSPVHLHLAHGHTWGAKLSL
jgi:hypothetical protein